jgi:1-phosphofructokinase
MAPRCCVFAPNISLTVTLEKEGDSGPLEVHFHPGGQGFWIARMLSHLGISPYLCGPIGGETGRVISSLVDRWGIQLVGIETPDPSPTVLQDRRSGDRELIAETTASGLGRHTLDDVYSTFLELALTCDVTVLTGQRSQVVPVDAYRRMAHDLPSAGVEVVGDFHGPELGAYLEGGTLEVLKVSDEDLLSDGLVPDRTEGSALEAIDKLRRLGATAVVVSRADNPTLAYLGGQLLKATSTRLDPADFRGAGDSMTAGLAAGIARGLDPESILRLACGAGAANVARHGLGSGSEELIAKLADRVEVEVLANSPRSVRGRPG